MADSHNDRRQQEVNTMVITILGKHKITPNANKGNVIETESVNQSPALKCVAFIAVQCTY